VNLPALGPRGEGWVAAQLVLFAAIGLGGLISVLSVNGGLFPLTLAAGVVIIAVGLLVAVRGAVALGSNLTPFPRPRPSATLVETGAYRYVRHPIYSGLVLAAGGWSVATASPLALVPTVLLALLFDTKSRREEAWLTERLPAYAAYRARTRKFVPGVY
jgi:protein-S-isoprenylcysteine O-methyltransferase Ste14